MKFKVGDRVRAIAEEDGNTKIIGQVGTVRGNYKRSFKRVEFDNDIGGHDIYGKYGHCWTMPESKLEKVFDDKIIITTDGKTTTARHYNGKRLIRSAEAKCSPEDTFDFMAGAKTAMDRLTAEQDDTVVDEIKVGDKVKVVDGLERYSSYSDWIIENAPEYAVYYAYGCDEDITGCFGKVAAKATHGDYKRMLYLVQLDGKACYLMGADGIVKLEE